MWKPAVPRVLTLVPMVAFGAVLGQGTKTHNLAVTIWSVVGFLGLVASLFLSDAGWEQQRFRRPPPSEPSGPPLPPERSETPPS